MPRINGGNVTESLGRYDSDLPKRQITADQLRSYLDTPATRQVSENTCLGRIRQRLDSEVDVLVQGDPWAPWVVELGIAHEELHFWRSAETMQTLAMALPYLSTSVRERTVRLLDRLFDQGVPLDRPTFANAGKRREYYDLSPPLLADRIARPPSSPAGLSDLYALWAYAQHCNRWDRVLPLLPILEQKFDTELTEPVPSDWSAADPIARMNGQIAGLIAYVRMLEEAEQTAKARDVQHRLARLVTERVHLERADSRLQTRIGHHARIPRYENLVPELCRMLADFAGEPLDRNARDLDRELPVWYQAWSERLIGGENYVSPPHLSRGLLAVMADGLQVKSDNLCRYLDQPWCRADLYYVEKLTAALRR